jgi:hypothetical protein
MHVCACAWSSYVLIGGMFVTALVPWWIVYLAAKLHFGYAFFFKAYFFHTRPSLKIKYDSTYRFWVSLPSKTTNLTPAPYTVSGASTSAATANTAATKSPAAKKWAAATTMLSPTSG